MEERNWSWPVVWRRRKGAGIDGGCAVRSSLKLVYGSSVGGGGVGDDGVRGSGMMRKPPAR